MDELFIAIPVTMSIEAIADVLRRTWSLEDGPTQPTVRIDSYSRAYITELDPGEVESDPLFFEDALEPEALRSDIGEFRLLSLRYTDPALAREMARAIVTSELAQEPIRLDADGTFRSPADFLARLGEQPEWDWFGGEGGQRQ